MKQKLTYLSYFIRSAWHVFMFRLFRKKKSLKKFLNHKNISKKSSDLMLKQAIESGVPFAAVRFGAVELSAINNARKIELGFKKTYKMPVKFSMKNNAGFFPCEDFYLTKYYKTLRKELKNIDILGISGVHMEEYYYKELCSQARIARYDVFEPIDCTWIEALKNKRVLIVSSFAEEIRHQLESKIEPYGVELLQTIEFKVVKAVETLAKKTDSRFDNWFDALDYLKMEILKQDFDVALIGAGAYGTPLCTFVKQIKKQAIQTGGATPLLFGVIGKRWETRDYVTKYRTSEWIKPYSKIEGAEDVEKGCYW